MATWRENLLYLMQKDQRLRTQDALAKALGVKQPTISTWLSGERTPRLSSLRRIASVYSIDFELFMGTPLTKITPVLTPLSQASTIRIPFIKRIGHNFMQEVALTKEFSVWIDISDSPTSLISTPCYESSINPNVSQGDLLLINCKKPPDNGEAVLFVDELNNPIVRAYKKEGGRVYLISLSGLPPIELTNSMTLVGVVKNIRRSVPKMNV